MDTTIIIKFAKTIKRYLPDLLTGAGIAGGIGAAVLTARATVKAVRKYDELDIANSEHKVTDTVEATWPYFVGPVALGVASAACHLEARKISAKDIKVLTEKVMAFGSAYKFSKDAYNELKESIDEPKGEKNVTVKSADPSKPINLVILPDKEYLCKDGLTGQMFTSSKREVMDHYMRLDWRLVNDMWISKLDYMLEFGLDPTDEKDAEDVGWNVFGHFLTCNEPTADYTEEGIPYLIFTPNVEPKKNFDMIG